MALFAAVWCAGALGVWRALAGADLGGAGVHVNDDGVRDVVFCGAGYDRVWDGGQRDPADRFYDCDEFSDRP